MVKEIKKGSQSMYVCEACNLAYKEREWAEKCQKWCQEHQSCNMEITARAAPIKLEKIE